MLRFKPISEQKALTQLCPRVILTGAMSEKISYSLSDSELLNYSREHLLHELQIFWWLTKELPTKPNGFELSALLESFAIHFRNLVNFLYPESLRRGDVTAADFCECGWHLGKIPDDLKSARERANKEVSHITCERKTGDDPNKPWDVKALFDKIDDKAKEFADAASEKKLHRKVVEWLRATPSMKESMLAVASTIKTNTVTQTNTFSCEPPGQ